MLKFWYSVKTCIICWEEKLDKKLEKSSFDISICKIITSDMLISYSHTDHSVK